MSVQQCDIFKAKQDLIIGRCKPKAGDLFVITSPTYANITQVKIDRKGKAYTNQGYLIDVSDLLKYFDKV